MVQVQALKETLRELAPSLELREGEPMSRHTTFRVGGPATLMALPKREEEALAAVKGAAQLGIRPVFLGNGSNLLVADSGIEGFVIKAVDGLGGIRREGNVLVAGSGILLTRLAYFAQREGLAGLEFANGIPGSLGGGVTMNAGAYGGELAQVMLSVTCVTMEGMVMELSAADCQFFYRRSLFSCGDKLILKAHLALQPGESAAIRAKMDSIAAQRREKQPLEYPSAGSAFKRPEGYFAAALIDQCGLKGLRVGGAQVSEKHAGFIVNRGGATCAQILELMEQVKKRVFDQTGVELEPEVRIIGG